MASLDRLARDRRTNAAVGWLFTGVVALGAVESLLTGALLWGGFALVVVGALALPALSTGDPTAMVSWPLPLAAAVAVVVRALGLYPEAAGYLAVASLALVAVVELDAFTSVEMSRRFAVGFAVATTMAVQALLTVAQFYSDRWLDTEFLRSQTELQWDLVVVTVVGLAAGGLFEWYAARYAPVGSPEATDDSAGSR